MESVSSITKKGFLFKEYDRIARELFAKRGATYELILKTLSEKTASLEDLYKALALQIAL